MLVTLATYNIHRCVGYDHRCDPKRTIEAIKAIDADVIALQEVETPALAGFDFLERVSQETGLTAIAGPTLFSKSGHYGNAVLTRTRVMAVRRIGLAHHGREPRGALDLDLQHGGVNFQIVATHLGLLPWERRLQIKRLLESFRRGATRPTALLGDFNEWFPWGRPLRWLHSYFGKQPTPRTFPARFPLFSLDRIWVHPYSALSRIEIPSTDLFRRTSDHLPVKAYIDW